MERLRTETGALLRVGARVAGRASRRWRAIARAALTSALAAAALAGVLGASASASGSSPTVVTGAATSVNETSATLNATVTPNGELSECKFEYGTTDAYGQSAPCKPFPAPGSTPAAVSAPLSGLEQASYHYRIVAKNAHATSFGTEQTFTTVLPHWYSNDKVINHNRAHQLRTLGTITLHSEAVAITCKVADEDTIENPPQGAAGTDTITAFELKGCKAPASTCPKGDKPAASAHGLPWSSELVVGPPVRDQISNVEFVLECTPKSGPAVVLAAASGTLAPEVAPDVLRFDSGSGELVGAQGAVSITGEDVLKVSKKRVISAKTAPKTFISGGEAVAWGRNIAEQLGVGFKTSSGGGEESPDEVLDLTGIKAIASGIGGSELGFALALMSNGTVESWGANKFGELGRDEVAEEEQELREKHCTLPEPSEGGEAEESEEGVEGGTSEKGQVSGLSNVVAISAAGSHELALSGGKVYAWGTNQDGEHGDKKGSRRCETGEPNSEPKLVESLSEVEAIASGGASNFALEKEGAGPLNGDVLAWGRDIEGKLGVGQPSKAEREKEKKQWEKETAEKEKGERETVAETTWLCNTEVGTQLCSKEPRPVTKLPKEVTEEEETAHITAISAGSGFALALYSNGTVRAWGGNGSSQLGTGSSEGKIYETPAKVKGLGESTGLGPAVAIAAGAGEPGHSLALLANGTVVGWGNDRAGELGPTSEVCKNDAPCVKTPRLILGLENIVAVSAGEDYSLALSADGVIYSLGLNKLGELGTGSTEEKSETPTPITGLGAVGAISAGEHSAYAILDSGVAAPTPLMAIHPGPESLEATWTFAATNPEKGFHVCYHFAIPKPKCPFQAMKLPPEQHSVLFGELSTEPYFVTVNNGEKTRGIRGTPLL